MTTSDINAVEFFLFKMLILELQFIDFGYSKNTLSNRRLREILWDIHGIISNVVYVSNEFLKDINNKGRVRLKKHTGEHKTPVKILEKEMLKIYRLGKLNKSDDFVIFTELKEYLLENLIIVHVTKKENETLKKLGLNQSLPKNGKDRYDVAGIMISNNVVKNGQLIIVSNSPVKNGATFNAVKTTVLADTDLFKEMIL